MNHIVNTLILLPMVFQLLSCASGQNKDQKKIEWQPGINAPKYYPCTSLGGEYSDGENYCPIARNCEVYDGWGQSGIEMTTGDFIPNKLTVRWLSLAENKFYGGTFALPQDTMRALFNQPVMRPNGFMQNYENIILNFYPLGGVAVWMQASCDRTVEIGHFQAKEIECPYWERVYPGMELTREEFCASVLSHIPGAEEYIAQHGISQEPFKTKYRQRYNYTFEIDSVPLSQTITVFADFYNGESEYIRGNSLADNFFKTKAVPKLIKILWVRDSIVYFGELDTDEDELFDVFAQMKNDCPDDPFVLKLKPDFGTSKLSISLCSKTKEIQTRKTGFICVSIQQERLKDLEYFKPKSSASADQ